MSIVKVVHDYPVPAETLWAVVTDYDALREIMKGIVDFEGVPTGRAHTGQKMNVMVSLFGKLPKQPYYIEVLECDNARRIMRSSEKGAGVESWLHTLTVEDTPNGSRLIESIEVKAGILTPIFSLWAKYLYNARHGPRLGFLEAKTNLSK